jgi:octaprenyl-diphosphate synthase
MERVMGIEPTSSAWEAEVLPLNYTRFGRRLAKIIIAAPEGANVARGNAQRAPNRPILEARNFLSLIASEMQAVDAVIRKRLHSEVPLVREIAEYIIASGGKRLRPALLLLAAGALGHRGHDCHELAAVVEFIHTATLLHDDVVDESTLRRGKETANAHFGNAASVLVGDFLYSRAFQMMVGVGRMRVMQVLADATNIIAEGEVLQLMNCHNADLSVEEYLRVVRYKTAKLFEASARLGAILGGAQSALEEGFAAYGMHLGTAFQIADDVLDYSGQEEELGKSLGDDLAEGKPTLPLIHVMQHGSPEQASLVRSALEQGGRDAFPQVIRAVKETGALDAALQTARDESARARDAIAALPDSQYREALLQLAAFAADRRY